MVVDEVVEEVVFDCIVVVVVMMMMMMVMLTIIVILEATENEEGEGKLPLDCPYQRYALNYYSLQKWWYHFLQLPFLLKTLHQS